MQLVLKAVYFYDPFNRRVTRWVGQDASHYYAWDGWQAVQEMAFFTANGSLSHAEFRQEAWGEQFDELIAYRHSVDTGASWQSYFVAEGGAHSPMRLLDGGGNVVEYQEYDAYGHTTYFDMAGAAHAESQRGNCYGWKGHEVDGRRGSSTCDTATSP